MKYGVYYEVYEKISEKHPVFEEKSGCKSKKKLYTSKFPENRIKIEQKQPCE